MLTIKYIHVMETLLNLAQQNIIRNSNPTLIINSGRDKTV